MIKYLSKAEVSHIEIVDDGLHTLNKQRTVILKDMAESQNLEYSVHAPFADINIASPSKPILNAVLRRLKESVAYASALNAYLWVFHPGLKTGISMFYPEQDWLQNLKTVKVLANIAKDYGVRIAIENVPEPFPFLMKGVKDFERFYDEADVDVGLVLDTGHANLNGQMQLFLEAFHDRIVHIHAHDNDGKGDQHRGIGYGTIEWAKFVTSFKKVSCDGVIVVESVEHVQESIKKIEQLFI